MVSLQVATISEGQSWELFSTVITRKSRVATNGLH